MGSMQVEKQPQEEIIAYMKNNTSREMHRDRYIRFTGRGPGPLPFPCIEAGKTERFTGFTSKGAVIYAGHNNEKCPTAWLLAWDTTPKSLLPSGPNKVFVACGRKSVIDKMTRDDILNSLNAATSPHAVATDPVTKATVKADLGSFIIPSGDTTLNATFGLAI